MTPAPLQSFPPPRRIAVLCSLACGLALLTTAGTAAHEPRPLGADGEIKMVVGWRIEPAYSGVHNAVDIHLNRADGSPVNTGEGDRVDLQVEIQLRESEAFDAPVVASAPVAEAPRLSPETTNRYNAWLTPTRPGAYAFRIRGSIDLADDEAGAITVDETYVCGGGARGARPFSCVAAPQTFPEPAPTGTDR